MITPSSANRVAAQSSTEIAFLCLPQSPIRLYMAPKCKTVSLPLVSGRCHSSPKVCLNPNDLEHKSDPL